MPHPDPQPDAQHPPADCPPAAELGAFHRGDLSAAAADAVAAHAETCPACEAALGALDAREGSMVAGLRTHRRPAPAADGPGTVIGGRYRLTAVLGEGGMGTVWRAEQTEPVTRAVAVKLVKSGMDSAAVLRRFEAERQALAVMDHPNIARVLDAGTTDRGRPFFAMELVDGVPITRYCDARRLGPRERLELFLPVCRAVQHAHQKGVIHRDLKPGNVLVAEVDGRPVPKVIDFGIAKATGVAPGGQTLQTGLGMVVGTPEYMAPEQADPGGADVDTRADVYALGVLLYELLTGSTPLTRQRAARGALLEVLRLVREEEPPTPSSRLSGADALPAIAADRGTEPARLSRLVRGELDWVVMKALEKDRTRRYESAGGFARDVERHLADEPVEAGRPTRGHRLRKFARRHRRPLAAAAALGLLLAAAAGVSTWLAVRATRAEAQAVQDRDAKQDALSRVESEQAKTAAALAAQTAIQEFYSTRVLQAGRPKGTENGLGKDVTLRAVLDAAVAALDTAFPQQPAVEAAVRHRLAESYLLMDAAPTALDHYRRAEALWQAAGRPADDPDALQTQNDIAVSLYTLRKWPEALALHERVLAARRTVFGPDSLPVAKSLRNVGATLYYLGRYPEAVAAGEETLRIYRTRLGDDSGETLRSLNNLASMYAKVGRSADTLRLFEELLAARRRLDRTPATASPFNTHMVMSNLGRLYDNIGRPADAVRLLEEVAPLQRANLGGDHTDTLDTLQALAAGYARTGRPADARAVCEELGPARRQKYGAADPRTLETLGTWARAGLATGRPAEAERLLAEQVAGGREHFRRSPADVAKLLAEVGANLQDAGRAATAVPYLRECLAVRSAAAPDSAAAAADRSRLGAALAGMGQVGEAEPLLLDGYSGLVKCRDDPAAAALLPAAADRLARFYNAVGNPGQAARWRAERVKYPPEVAPPPRPVN